MNSSVHCPVPEPDTSHATPAAAIFFRRFFEAKSQVGGGGHEAWMELFDPERARFRDAVLGFGMGNPGMSGAEQDFASSFGPNSRADLLRVLGDEHSAVVFSYDTHDMFGAEIWAASAIDVSGGRVLRNVDYWDGRLHPVSAMRAPESHFDTQLAEDAVVDSSDSTITRVARGLGDALAAGDAATAADLLSPVAIWEDQTLRTRVEGRRAIERYLQRSIASLPYGAGSSVRHVLGFSRGGGYEWRAGSSSVPQGITGLELNADGLVTRLTALWDGARMETPSLQRLALLALESEPIS